MILRKTLTLFIPLAAMLIGLPLMGVALAGKPVSLYLAFPPVTTFVVHAPFSWWVFWTLVVLVLAFVTPFIYCVIRSTTPTQDMSAQTRVLPWWGWLGIAIMVLAWSLAWNRFSWFQRFQEYTFSPLWLGYILFINALTRKRTGHCMLQDRTGYFLALFPLSAGFWWFFEYLNRFAQNWHYVGVSELGPWEYFWQATLPFSTVLPAVLSTRDCLASFPRLSSGLLRVWPIRLIRPKQVAWATLLIAGLGLAGIGIWPEHLYALLWVAPLFIIVALQATGGEPTIFDSVADGDWRRLWLAALAALICGFFWELWNYKSLAHWEYSIPYVDRFEIFHMPMLGYAGYLPFGLQCLAIVSVLDQFWRNTSRPLNSV
ncbi:MAG: hypothetical protein ACE5NW_05670 [Acidiferrobacterales bacterium]